MINRHNKLLSCVSYGSRDLINEYRSVNEAFIKKNTQSEIVGKKPFITLIHSKGSREPPLKKVVIYERVVKVTQGGKDKLLCRGEWYLRGNKPGVWLHSPKRTKVVPPVVGGNAGAYTNTAGVSPAQLIADNARRFQ